jgi:polyadenylate-binding protein
LNVPLQYDSLSALSPVVRKEVLSGELTRRIKSLGAVRNDEVEPLVDSIVSLSLSDVVSVIQDPTKLADRVRATRSLTSPSPAPSQDSRLLDPVTSAAIASAPEHPSTPVSIPGSIATPPRTSSPSGSLHPTSERERMVQAISRLEKSQIGELTDLLMSLPKRERALCLFNTELLRAKIADAKIVLEAAEEEELAPAPAPIPATPQKRAAVVGFSTPETPDLSSRGPSVAASPAPQTPGTTASTHNLDSLAQLSFTKIYDLINSGASLPSLSVSPELIEETNQWVASVSAHSLPTFKEQAGRKW